MLYAIMNQEAEDTLAGRKVHRPEHLARLHALHEEGRLVLAGPHPAVDSEEPGNAGFTGSLIVAEFESLLAAETWAAADPFIEHGIYAHATVKPFKRVLP